MNEHRNVQLLQREEHPPALTLYVEIPLDIEGGTKPMTGIFIPENYVPRPQVDIILYLHGFRRPEVCGRDPVSIDRYWRSISSNRSFYFPLREETNSSEKNVILVAPTLGPKSEWGQLAVPKKFEGYLNNVLAALRKYGPYQNGEPPPTCKNIILACHSGGGKPMRRVALGKHPYANQIRECWGFDCLYEGDDPEQWADWADHHRNAKLFIHHLDSTKKHSNDLKDKSCSNVFVERSTTKKDPGHCWVPKEHWRQRAQASAFLQAKSTTNESVSEARNFDDIPKEERTPNLNEAALRSVNLSGDSNYKHCINAWLGGDLKPGQEHGL
jgi:hypothetical protein